MFLTDYEKFIRYFANEIQTFINFAIMAANRLQSTQQTLLLFKNNKTTEKLETKTNKLRFSYLFYPDYNNLRLCSCKC